METDRKEQLNTERVADHSFYEYPYRWVIVSLMGVMFIINGLANNTVIPIAQQISRVYNISKAYTSSPVTISLLISSLVNFPANHIIDTKGLRISFLLGAGLFMTGAFFYTLVNRGYFFAVMGAILVATGQPFILNCPAKIATYWFFDHNRPLATALMTGLLLVGSGFGFLLPAILVSERASTEEAKTQIFDLYAGQFLASAVAFILVFIFMRKQPPTPPSIGAEQQKTDLRESFKLFKKNRNLWIFFAGFIIIYGTLLSFSTTVNLQMRPYGYSDIQIALFALILIIMGVVGSILFSLFLKKTMNYRLTIRSIPTISVVVMVAICIALAAHAPVALIFILGGGVGFSITPIIPISYDLGCQLSFPIGEAQVIGFLNAGSMIFAFFVTLFVTQVIKLGTPKHSLIAMVIYILLVLTGTVLYYFIKIDLRRRKAEQQGHTVDLEKVVAEADQPAPTDGEAKDNSTTQDDNEPKIVIQMTDTKYVDLNQEQEVYI